MLKGTCDYCLYGAKPSHPSCTCGYAHKQDVETCRVEPSDTRVVAINIAGVEHSVPVALIAAAPEMLALLTKAHNMLPTMLHDKPAVHRMVGMGKVAGCLGCDIMNLIAKIEGKGLTT